MRIIVAVSSDWGIGKDNKLLFSLKEDMRFFRETTMGKVVVMGKNTYLSLPKRPLKNRTNIVLSSTQFGDGAISVSSMDALFAEVGKYDTDEVYVIGGASMYRQMLPYCDIAYITKVKATAEADTYFTDLDACPDWECVRERDAEDTYPITFCTYKNNNVKRYEI
ncbi:MAG: dihydrofolate reductase [Clostridiales bacterium]|nr:dihydrofolate reductase [Clostridiales bacterium]